MFNLPSPPAAPPDVEPDAHASVDSAAAPPEPVKEETTNDAGQPPTAPKDKPSNDTKTESGIAADPYEWGQCAITLHVVWLPSGQVMASVRSHLDAPIITLLANDQLTTLPGHAAELPLPSIEALADLLAQLREDLPRRAQTKVQRDELSRKKADDAKASPSTKSNRNAKKNDRNSEPAKADKGAAKPAAPKAIKAPPPAQVSLFDMIIGAK